MSTDNKPIIIIGAGLVGLTVAQGLKKAGFSYQIFDRDGSMDERPAGWGITMHWALPSLEACLPRDVFEKIQSIQVDPVEGGKEHDSYKFLNLETGEEKSSVPSSTHYRLNRKKFRQLLGTDIEVQWGMKFTSFETTDSGVVVKFADGTQVEGSVLLGVDGKNSRIKPLLVGEEKAKLNSLPVAFLGLSLHLSPEKMQPFRDIHPILWQGCHPTSGYFIFFSMLSTPQSNGSAGTDDEHYEGQFNMSWMVDRNGKTPPTAAEQIARVKAAAKADSGMFQVLQQAILNIPENTPALEIKLEDWPAQNYDNRGGRVALLGDAAHTMTMYRGEAANHGIYDAVVLVHQLLEWKRGKKSREQALKDYQDEVVERTFEAVLLSRYACIECHDLDALNENSKVFQVSGFNARIKESRATYDLSNDSIPRAQL